MTAGKLGRQGDSFRLGGGGVIGWIESLIGMNYFLRLNAVMTKPMMVNKRPGSPKKKEHYQKTAHALALIPRAAALKPGQNIQPPIGVKAEDDQRQPNGQQQAAERESGLWSHESLFYAGSS
jgi:hypothetical protein